MKGKNTSTIIPAKQVGIWIRVSTEDQAQGDSPKHHELRARAYAEAKGWQVLEVYDLSGVSGKSVIEHPECKRMMNDIKNGHISTLIFSKIARLARNTKELLDFADYFRTQDADLVSLSESIDTSTPSGRLFYTVIAAMSQWEREEITERIKASVAVRAKLGKPLSGRVPFGYHYKDGKVQPHPEEAAVRKLIYELFAEHKRKKTVARILNERGYRTRGSKTRPPQRFSDTTVERLIRDTMAKGEHRGNYTYSRNNKKAWAYKPEHEWVINPVEPIISKELWDTCNRLLEERKTKGKRPGPKVVHTFTGLVVCTCGKKMYVPSNTPKYVCNACHVKIPIVDLEAMFHDDLKQFVFSPERVTQYLNAANDELLQKTQLLDSLRKERDRTKGDADALIPLYNKGLLTSDQFKERFQPLDARTKQIGEEIPRVEALIDVLKVDGLNKEHIIQEGQTFYDRWPKMNKDERRQIAELFIEKIIVGEDDLTMNYTYVPSYELMTERQRGLAPAATWGTSAANAAALRPSFKNTAPA